MRKLYITKKHILIEVLSYVMIAISLAIATAGVIQFEEIPAHYDFYGNIDGYGSPVVLFFMPCVLLISNLLISLVIHFMKADSWNMPFQVKENRRLAVYRDIVSMDVCLQVEIAAYGLFFTIQSYHQTMKGVLAVTGILILLIILTTVLFWILASKHNKM